MDLSKLIGRSVRIMVNPEEEWQEVSSENSNYKEVFVNYIIPYFLMILVSSLLGSIIFKKTSSIAAFYFAIVTIIMYTVFIFTLSPIVKALGKSYGKTLDFNVGFLLLAFSFTPLYIIEILINLFPFASSLIVVGLYSFYILGVGFGKLLGVPDKDRLGYVATFFVIILIEYGLLYAVFNVFVPYIFDFYKLLV